MLVLAAITCWLSAADSATAEDSLQWGHKNSSPRVTRRKVANSLFRDPKITAAAWNDQRSEEIKPTEPMQEPQLALEPELALPHLDQPSSVAGPGLMTEMPEAEIAPAPEPLEEPIEDLRFAQTPADPFEEDQTDPADSQPIDLFEEDLDLFDTQDNLDQVQESVEDEMLRREDSKLSQSTPELDDYDLFDEPTNIDAGGAGSDLQKRLESVPDVREAPEVGDSELFDAMTDDAENIFEDDLPDSDYEIEDVDEWLDLNLLKPGTKELTEQQRKILDEERIANEESCLEEIEKLGEQRLENIDLSIRVEGEPGRDYPFECSLQEQQYEGRCWPQLTYMWKASGLCHKPLYFEQTHLERHGHSWGPYAQPLLSGIHFFGTVPILPYKMGLKTPNECVYTLGHYRPGSCAPYLIDPLPVTWRAIGFQTGAATGLSFLVP